MTVTVLCSLVLQVAWILSSCQTTAAMSVSLEQSSYTVAEADGSVEVCVIGQGLDPGTAIETTLSTAPDGFQSRTAVAGLDYIMLNATSCFLSNTQLRCCINITILEDSQLENDEYFRVRLNSLNPNVFLTSFRASIIIKDSNNITISLEQSTYTVSGPENTVQICAGLTTTAVQLARTVAVLVNASSRNSEFRSLYPTRLTTFYFSSSSSRLCWNISTTVYDVNVFLDDRSIQLLRGARVSFDISMAIIFITNFTLVSLEQSSYTVAEADNSVEVCVAVTQRQPNPGAVIDIETTLSTIEETARDVLDYSAINVTSCSLSESAPSCCVNIPVLQDSLKEVRERFTVQLQLDSDDTSITLGVSRATVFITDSNTVTISLEQSTYNVTKADSSVEICARVIKGQLAITLFFWMNPLGRDYQLRSTSRFLRFTPTQSRQCRNISLTFYDLEPNVSVLLRPNEPSSSILLNISMATIFIRDSYVEPIYLEVAVEDRWMTESNVILTQGKPFQLSFPPLTVNSVTCVSTSPAHINPTLTINNGAVTIPSSNLTYNWPTSVTLTWDESLSYNALHGYYTCRTEGNTYSTSHIISSDPDFVFFYEGSSYKAELNQDLVVRFAYLDVNFQLFKDYLDRRPSFEYTINTSLALPYNAELNIKKLQLDDSGTYSIVGQDLYTSQFFYPTPPEFPSFTQFTINVTNPTDSDDTKFSNTQTIDIGLVVGLVLAVTLILLGIVILILVLIFYRRHQAFNKEIGGDVRLDSKNLVVDTEENSKEQPALIEGEEHYVTNEQLSKM